MKFRRLIAQSESSLNENYSARNTLSIAGFHTGARWMAQNLNAKKSSAPFNTSANYTAYGLFKYSISLLAFAASAYLLMQVSWWLVPLSVPVFYIFEIHFLFLFPLLLDNVKRPLLTSVQQTYKTGMLTALFTVMPLGFFMLAGLLNVKNPLRNWYVGCLAIVIWYRDEVRARIQPSV